MSIGRLRLAQSHWEEIRAHVAASLPSEACGLLGGRDGCVLGVYAVRNVSDSSDHFRMHPAEQVRALHAIDERGWTLAGIYHSHPRGPAWPSPDDLEQASYPEAVHVIWSPGGSGEWSARAFRIVDRRAEEITIDVMSRS